jgi:hypothetical protein
VLRRAALTRMLRPEARRQHALAAPRGGDQFTFAITRRAIRTACTDLDLLCAGFDPLAAVTAGGSFLVGVIRTYLKIA